MPHAEIRYSGDLRLDTAELFEVIESVINDHDPNAHECKCRAYPSAEYRYPHVLVAITMLARPHRDDAFTTLLMQALETALKRRIRQSCHFSLLVEYSPASYVTNQHHVPGDELPVYVPPAG